MDALISLLVGILLGFGILLSGLGKRYSVIGLFLLNGEWNPSVLLTFLTAVTINYGANRMIFKRDRPIFNSRFELPTNKIIDQKLVLGGCLYGMGYGMSGLSPSANFTILFLFQAQQTIIYLCFMLCSHFITSFVVEKYFRKNNSFRWYS